MSVSKSQECRVTPGFLSSGPEQRWPPLRLGGETGRGAVFVVVVGDGVKGPVLDMLRQMCS